MNASFPTQSQSMTPFGRKLKHQLSRVGMNQSELAKAIGVLPSAVSHWVNGSNNPSMDNILAISKALGCKVQDLIDLDPNITRTTLEEEMLQLFRQLAPQMQANLVETARAFALTKRMMTDS